MNALLGIQEDRVADFVAHLKGWKIDIAPTPESFWTKMENVYQVIVLEASLFEEYPWEFIGRAAQMKGNAEIFVMVSPAETESLWLDVISTLSGPLEFRLLYADADNIAEQLLFAVGGGQRKESQPTHNRIVAFQSANPKDGASTIAINTAIALAELHIGSVGLLDLNLKSPEIGYLLDLPYRERNNMRIRPKLYSRELTPDDLLAASVKYSRNKNLYMLPGTYRRDTALDLSADMIRHLLKVATQTFDIVLVDIHAYPDNAATIVTVRNAALRYVTAKNELVSYGYGWGDWYNHYWQYCGLEKADFRLIANRIPIGERVAHMEKDTGVSLGHVVPDAGEWAQKAVREGQALVDLRPRDPFAESIRGISTEIAVSLGLKEQAAAPKKAGLMGWVSALASAKG
jgi:pilus assembly protein CpaE